MKARFLILISLGYMQDRQACVVGVPLQWRVWTARRDRWTYERIQREFGLKPRDIVRCLTRTSLGQVWERRMTGPVGDDAVLRPIPSYEELCLDSHSRNDQQGLQTGSVGSDSQEKRGALLLSSQRCYLGHLEVMATNSDYA